MSRFLAVAFLAISLLIPAVFAATPWVAPTEAEVQAALDGLDFDEFIDQSYELYLLRFPQGATSAGISADHGLRNNALNDYSDGFTQETHAIERLILSMLSAFDRGELTGEQQMTYDIAVWYWDDLVRAQEHFDYWLSLHFMGTRSLHGATEHHLTRSHPIETLADMEDYLERLSAVGAQFDQIIALVEFNRQLGIVAPRKTLEWAISSIRTNMTAFYRMHPFYTTLRDKAELIVDVDEAQRDAILDAAADAIDEVVKPAYRRLYDEILSLLDDAPAEVSLSRFGNEGLAAYDYELRHHTGTERTADEIHASGLVEVARVQAELKAVAQELWQDPTMSIPEIIANAAIEGGTAGGQDAIDLTESMIAEAQALVLSSGALNALPSAPFEVRGSADGGGYYSPGASDGSRPGVYYISSNAPMEKYRMASVAFHETIPGHHVQIATAQELDIPLLRQDAFFAGFGEGWALYSERLMYELGYYDDNPLGNIGRLKYELLRAVRLVVDTGIHALGWSFEETVTYLMENLGDPRGTAEYRVLRYTVIPGQATSYMTGMLEILDLRDLAQATLGEAFDLASFHNVLLVNGNVPLTLVRQLVEAWIAELTASAS